MARLSSLRSRRMLSRSAATLAALAVALAPYGALPVDTAVAAEVVVRITDRLEPAQVTVAAGTTVTWVNEDGERHRVRSESGPARFDSGNLDTGESFSFGFTEAGQYRYVDARNDAVQAYWGTVVVTANEPPPPEPPPDPGTPPPPPPPPGGGGGETVSIGDRVYVPFTVTIPVGSSVSWRNNDDRIHTVTSTGGVFDSGIMQVGDLYRRTFNQAGAFDYFCTVHPDMTGSVIVTGDAAAPDPPPEPDPPPAPEPPPAPPAPGPAPSGDVRIVDFSYSPQSVTVAAGTSLTFANAGAAPHTVTATAGGFDSGLMLAGDVYRRSFPTPGTYDYFCAVHPEMTGRVVVTGSAAPGTPPPEPEPPPPEPPDPGPPAGPPPSGDVRIVDLAYSPRSLTVAAGSTVTWANAGDLPHTVTATAGSFDSGIMLAGDTYRRRFATPGTYEYLCTIHPAMTARVVVTGTAGGAGGADTAVSAASEPAGGAIRPFPDLAVPLSGEPAQLAEASSTAAPPGAPVSAEMIDFDYDPAVVTVPVGGSVEWRNTGVAPHTVTARDGSFDSGLVASGEAWIGSFDTVGAWEYFCTVHPNMTATLRVVAAAGEPAPVGAQVSAAGPTIDFSQLASESLVPEPTGTSPLRGALLVAIIVAAVAIVAAGAALAQPFRRPPAA